jgi:hypothetical protein
MQVQGPPQDTRKVLVIHVQYGDEWIEIPISVAAIMEMAEDETRPITLQDLDQPTAQKQED